MKDILCFGDSNTYGLIPGTKERYGWGIRWTSLVNKRLEKYGYKVIEEGLCGRTTLFEDPLRKGRRAVINFPMILESHTPLDGIIIMLGTNDCKTVYGSSSHLIGKGIEQLIEQSKALAPQSKILLVSPIYLGEKIWHKGYDPEFSKASIVLSKQLDSVYQQIAKDKNVAFLAASTFAKSSEIDQEHLDEEGHRRLAEGIFLQLKREFKLETRGCKKTPLMENPL